MSTLTAFLSQNVKKNPNVFYPATKRIIGEDGKPVNWEIKCISATENKDLKKDCYRTVPVPGKKGRFTQEFDADKYARKAAVHCTAFPNLNDAALQDSWGVTGAEELLLALLNPGEFEDYAAKVLEVNGFNNEGDLVEDAKN